LARVALDAMGGDFAPRATVTGALLALAERPAGLTVQLVGRAAVVERALDDALAGELAALAAHRDRVTIIDAPDVIEMSDRPTAVRSKPKSSMMVGLRLQADGQSDAFVSAGNTGAQMAASLIVLRLHGELKRPAIGTLFPAPGGKPVVVLDSGANVDCTADELVQFARLGTVYAQDMLGRRNPAVGLLSIGEEAEKGNAVVKEAHQRLRTEPGINFVGNVEGRDIPTGRCEHSDALDVVVCDGFVGNVLLKFYESLAPTLMDVFSKALGTDPEVLMAAFKELDYSEHGGAPLLGVNGVSIISHGKSSPRAIKNAILAAVRAVESRMSEHIGRRLADAAAASAESASTSSAIA
jgi:glycerol-3-phosphate acyltransferase PlsX